MFYDEMQVTLDRAAELLPDPPGLGNPEGYARWEALTLDTGRLLARLLGADIGLLKALMDDECLTPVECRPRRRLLLRVAVLWACQVAKTKTTELGAPYRLERGSMVIAKTAVNGLGPRPLLARPIWLDAR